MIKMKIFFNNYGAIKKIFFKVMKMKRLSDKLNNLHNE